MRIEQYFYVAVDEDTENVSVMRQKSSNLPNWWESPYQGFIEDTQAIINKMRLKYLFFQSINLMAY